MNEYSIRATCITTGFAGIPLNMRLVVEFMQLVSRQICRRFFSAHHENKGKIRFLYLCFIREGNSKFCLSLIFESSSVFLHITLLFNLLTLGLLVAVGID